MFRISIAIPCGVLDFKAQSVGGNADFQPFSHPKIAKI
jgi:hypothetical protein